MTRTMMRMTWIMMRKKAPGPAITSTIRKRIMTTIMTRTMMKKTRTNISSLIPGMVKRRRKTKAGMAEAVTTGTMTTMKTGDGTAARVAVVTRDTPPAGTEISIIQAGVAIRAIIRDVAVSQAADGVLLRWTGSRSGVSPVKAAGPIMNNGEEAVMTRATDAAVARLPAGASRAGANQAEAHRVAAPPEVAAGRIPASSAIPVASSPAKADVRAMAAEAIRAAVAADPATDGVARAAAGASREMDIAVRAIAGAIPVIAAGHIPVPPEAADPANDVFHHNKQIVFKRHYLFVPQLNYQTFLT